MKKFKGHNLSSALMAFMMLIPGSVMASHICWVDKVISTSNGITLKFRPDVYLIGGVKYRNKQKVVHIIIDQGLAHITGENGQQDAGAEVVLNAGDMMGLHQGVEDSCDVEAVEQGGRAGVLLHALSTMPPYGPSRSSEFVSAELNEGPRP